MNKTYQVIWSKVKSSYIVVSEIAKQHRNGATSGGGYKAVALMCATLLCAGGSVALAADPLTSPSIIANNVLWSHGYLVVGAQETPWGNSTVMDRSASIGTNNQIDGWNSMAVGLYNNVYGNASIASGWTNRAYAFGSYAFGRENNAYASYSFAGGMYSEAGDKGSADLTTSAGRGTLQNNDNGLTAFAYGYRAKALGYAATAVGNRSEALADNSFAASGGKVTKEAENSVALGMDAFAEVADAVALGSGSVASVDKDVIGYNPGGTELTDATIASEGKELSTWKSTAAAIAVGNAENGITRQIIGVAAGKEDTDAVNVAQLKEVAAKVANGNATSNTVTAGENVSLVTTDKADGSHNYQVSVKATGKVAAGDTKLISGDAVFKEARVKADGTYIRQNNTAGENLTALDKQVATNTQTLDKMGDNMNNMGNSISQLDHRVTRIGAGAATLAALHPQDFDPGDKWDFAVGYGNYKDANAIALGAFYRPNPYTTVSVGTSFGGGENMVNAGVSFKMGQSTYVPPTSVASAKDVLELKQIVEQQNEKIQQLMDGKMPEVAVQEVGSHHWAYTHIKALADKGYLAGYLDSQLKENRTINRYECATAIYRALKNGAPVDADMGRALGAFGHEIQMVAEAEQIRVK